VAPPTPSLLVVVNVYDDVVEESRVGRAESVEMTGPFRGRVVNADTHVLGLEQRWGRPYKQCGQLIKLRGNVGIFTTRRLSI